MKKVKNTLSTAYLSVFGVLLLPMLVSAQSSGRGITGFLHTVRGWLNMLVPMMITLGIIAFFWGLAQYLFTDGEDKKKGLNRMLMGILAVFVMGSIGGIVKMLQDTTNTTGNQHINNVCVGNHCNNY